MQKSCLKFDDLYDWQKSAVTLLIGGRDVIAHVTPGLGKSYIYVYLALVKKIVVLQPLKALLEDQHSRYRSYLIHGDIENKDEVINKFNLGDINLLFITPESYKIHGSKIKNDLLVIDEAHLILADAEQGFRPACKEIFEMYQGQICLLSGTFTADDIFYFKSKRDFEIVTHLTEKANLHFFYHFYEHFNPDILRAYNLGIKKSLIFVNRKIEAEYLAQKFNMDKFAYFHSGLKKNKKKQILDDFNSGKINCIFSTSALAMGVDFKSVELVVHYQLPRSLSEFQQKSSRAGRDGQRAEVIIINSPQHLDTLAAFCRDKKKAVDSYVSILNTFENLLKKL